MTSTSSAHLICLCGAISAPGTLLADRELPISTEICHCNTCRHTNGSLGASFPTLNFAPSQDTLTKLTAYQSSANVTRFFCAKCGCHCFLLDRQEQTWYCLGGIIEQGSASKADKAVWPKDTVKVSRHHYVLDTVDGGLAPLLLSLNGRDIPTCSAALLDSPQQDSSDIPHATVLSLPGKSISTLPHPEEDSYLPAKCHCGGVSLLIKRANHTPEVLSRVTPSGPTKYLAYLCACRSCRLSTGVSLTPWTLVPPMNVFNAASPDDLLPLVFGYQTSTPTSNLGLSLSHHWSSPDVCRSFCSTCGATVSYWCGRRPDELDLAVGILRSEEGSMARRWLEWIWGRCSSTEESIDDELTTAWLGSAKLMERIGD